MSVHVYGLLSVAKIHIIELPFWIEDHKEKWVTPIIKKNVRVSIKTKIKNKVCRSNIEFVLNKLKTDFRYLTKVNNRVTFFLIL